MALHAATDSQALCAKCLRSIIGRAAPLSWVAPVTGVTGQIWKEEVTRSLRSGNEFQQGIGHAQWPHSEEESVKVKASVLLGRRWAVALGGVCLAGLPLLLQAADTHLSDSLRHALEEQGWQREEAADGSLIYRQPTPGAAPDQATGTTQDLHKGPLQRALKKSGWQVEWTGDGSLLLRPGAGHSPVTRSRSIPSTAQPPQIPDLPGFEYWRIERGDKGALLFHPLARPPAGAPSRGVPGTLGACEGYGADLASVSLPVDTWAEAKRLASAWIEASGKKGLTVGRIRKILRVYLVSLVADTPPYKLRHQLAIRTRDARVMLLE